MAEPVNNPLCTLKLKFNCLHFSHQISFFPMEILVLVLVFVKVIVLLFSLDSGGTKNSEIFVGCGGGAVFGFYS